MFYGESVAEIAQITSVSLVWNSKSTMSLYSHWLLRPWEAMLPAIGLDKQDIL